MSSPRDPFKSNCLKNIDAIAGMTLKQTIKLKRAIVDNMEDSPDGAGQASIAAAKTDLRNVQLLQKLVAKATSDVIAKDIDQSAITISHEILDWSDFRLASNLSAFGLDKYAEHKVLEHATNSLYQLNYRIEEMKNFGALSGTTDAEIDLMGNKFSFLIKDILPSTSERRFERLVSLSGLPRLSDSDSIIDAEELLRIRETVECREFRSWLQTSDFMSDAEIESRIKSLGAKVGTILRGPVGKTVRFLVCDLVGKLVDNPLVGTSVGAVDSFVLDRLLPKGGPAAFVGQTYRSILRPKL